MLLNAKCLFCGGGAAMPKFFMIVHYSNHNSDFIVDVIGRYEGGCCCSTTCGELSRCLPFSTRLITIGIAA